MEEVFRSVFRQRKVEKIYCVGYNIESMSFYKYRKEVKFEIESVDLNVLSDEIIGTYDIKIPLLEPGDKFYLNDINETVVIQERMRSSDGSIVYYYTDKLVETEKTKESFEKCQLQKEKFDEITNENDELHKLIRKLKIDFNDYKSQYKYKHRWFNFKGANNGNR